jgi:glycosyltransferase involved in cell wall biosynthesis
MKRVVIRAPLLSYSGYGTHSRQVFRWLLSKKDLEIRTQVVPWGITPWMINPDYENGLVGEIMNCSSPPTSPVQKSDLSIQIQLPNEWDSSLATQNIGISAFVETDRCNPQWIECCNKMSKVIVPSPFIASVIKNSGSPLTPIDVVPESFYDDIAKELLPPSKLDFSTDFNFLVFGQFTGNNPENDRKNLFNTIRILCQTFADDPDVGIVIKTNNGKNTTIDRSITENVVRKVINEIRPGPYPKVHIIHGAMFSDEIASLYRHPKIKALVSLTRGEGFGLPILEAATSGLPIIATDWSAHVDFLKKGKYIPVSYDLVNVPTSRIDGQIFMEGACWAEVSYENAQQRFIKFRKSPHVPQRWAKELRKKLLKSYSQESINNAYDKALGDYLT